MVELNKRETTIGTRPHVVRPLFHSEHWPWHVLGRDPRVRRRRPRPGSFIVPAIAAEVEP